MGPVTVAVASTATEVDRWVITSYSRVAVSNLDVTQTIVGWLESRSVVGSGSWGKVGETLWTDIVPGESRDYLTPETTRGAGEVRFMAIASGAGANCTFTRMRTYE